MISGVVVDEGVVLFFKKSKDQRGDFDGMQWLTVEPGEFVRLRAG